MLDQQAPLGDPMPQIHAAKFACMTRACSDPMQSDRRSRSLFDRIFFDEPENHFVGKCSGISAGETALDGTVTLIQRPCTPRAFARSHPSSPNQPTRLRSLIPLDRGVAGVRVAGAWQSTQLRGFHEAPTFCA
jgi:hypothetical protein